MKFTFFIEKHKAQKIQKMLKNYKTLRFRHNPIVCGDKVEIPLEGDVEEFNTFDQELELLENSHVPPKNVAPWFKRFLGRKIRR
jgi:hypothetical protein